jgi:hypothetical protein
MLLFSISSLKGQSDIPTLSVIIGVLRQLRHIQEAPFVAGPSSKLPVQAGRVSTIESSR